MGLVLLRGCEKYMYMYMYSSGVGNTSTTQTGRSSSASLPSPRKKKENGARLREGEANTPEGARPEVKYSTVSYSFSKQKKIEMLKNMTKPFVSWFDIQSFLNFFFLFEKF